MTRVKVEHFVPQFYLRGWADAKQRLYVFDKPSGASFQSNVRKASAEGGFYDDSMAAGEDAQRLEKWLSEVEDELAIVLRSVISDLDAGLLVSTQRRQELSVLMALQSIRTAEWRRGFEQSRLGLVRALEGEQLGPEVQALVDDAVDLGQTKADHNSFIMRPEFLQPIASVLFNHIWLVGVNDTNMPLWTSDHPVVSRANIYDPHVSYSGLGSKGIEVHFPLSPRYVLMLAERSFHWRLNSQDGTRTALFRENIIYCNSLQVAQAYRQVFSTTPQFDIAHQMRAEKPHLFDLDRQRVSVVANGQEV